MRDREGPLSPGAESSEKCFTNQSTLTWTPLSPVAKLILVLHSLEKERERKKIVFVGYNRVNTTNFRRTSIKKKIVVPIG